MTPVPADFSPNIGGGKRLRDEGLTPKRFRVVVKKQVFNSVYGAKYSLQLCFDRSPYPGVEEWLSGFGVMVESIRSFGRTVFVGGEMDEQRREGKAFYGPRARV
ncbi:hypothetical protein CC2G_008443 [Coprinopsis cinerea AmutBmut pab1-1]|nr:hypothetical protein CC2G_008443 [Coprinopsis cinerea AmutBmut pab1-1]